MVLHLPIAFQKTILGWSQYLDLNPIPSNLLVIGLVCVCDIVIVLQVAALLNSTQLDKLCSDLSAFTDLFVIVWLFYR